MPEEQTIAVSVKRHVITIDRPFTTVLDAIYQGISQPDIEHLFHELGTSKSYEQFSSLVNEAQGSAGLMKFLQLELDNALMFDTDSRPKRLVRVIAGNPATMGQMTRHVPDAGSYAPVTILVQETTDGTRVAYDSVSSELAPYHNGEALAVAEQLDTEVLTLLRDATS